MYNGSWWCFSMFQVQHPSMMDYWEGLHILTTVFFWLTICLNIMMLLLLLISRISPLRAIDVSQFFHYLFFAPISILLGAPSEVFAFMSMRPEEYKHTHSKVFFQYPFYRLILISLFLHGSPWTQIFWFLYVSGAYVANSWVPMQYIGVSNNHSYPRNEDDGSVFPISFGKKQGYEGLGKIILKCLSRDHKTRKCLSLIIVTLNYFDWMDLQCTVLYMILCTVTERVGFPSFVKYIGPFLSLRFEANEGILCNIVYSIVEAVVLVCFIIILCRSVPDVLVLLANIVFTLSDLRTAVFRNYRADMRRLWGFQKATSAQLRAYNDVCAICLCSMPHGRVTLCEHIFHGQCLRRSLEARTTCPLCNTRLIPFLPRS